MAKPKSPLLSLGARGTIADALTYQKRGLEHIVRQKPIPRDPYSLNQAYQRWDYRDYAYLWTLLSNAEKQIYRTKASRYHITGFSLWMRERLKDLTNLVGRWHLDEKSGAVAYDSSKNTNNAIIIGASPATGVIDGAFTFDGINDWLDCGTDPSLNLLEDMSFEAFINPSLDQTDWFFSRGSSNIDGYYAFIRADGKIGFRTCQLGAQQTTETNINALTANVWQHIVINRAASAVTIFVNDQEATYSIVGNHISPASSTRHFYIAQRDDGLYQIKALIDHFVARSRTLHNIEILRHSERRYPA